MNTERQNGAAQNPDESQPTFLDMRLPRRRLLRWGLGAGIAASAGNLNFTQVPDIINGLKAGYEYGPGFVSAVASDPEAAWETWKLIQEPDETYRKSPFFGNSLEYPTSAHNVLIAFGDSNMVGAEGRDRANSPVSLFKRRVKDKWGTDWEDYNIAHSGDTTKLVIQNQLQSQQAKEAFSKGDFCDVWINVGGNDFSSVANTPDEFSEVKELGQDPWRHPDYLLKYTPRLLENLTVFRRDFHTLLSALYEMQGAKIKHIVIMSAPDFGKAPSITSQDVGDKKYHIPLDDDFASKIVHNLSIRMNNEMFGAASEFHGQTGTKIVGIDTFKDSIFDRDQHLTVEAVAAIADDAFSRVEFHAA